MKSLTIGDLEIWQTQRLSEPFIPLPNHHTRFANPVVVNGFVAVSCFSGKKISVYAKKNGKLLWSRPLGYYGGAFLCHSNGSLLVHTVLGVQSLELKTGKVQWAYQLFDGEGEYSYSGAAYYGKKVLMGDVFGNLHCLDAKTGQLLWKSIIVEDARINGLPLQDKSSLFVVTNTGVLSRVNVKQGSVSWKIQLEEGALHSPIKLGEQIVVPCHKSLYVVSPEAKKVRRVKVFNIADALPLKNTLLCVGQSVSSSGKENFYLKCFKDLKSMYVRKISGSPAGIVPTKSKEHICIVSIGQIEFFSLKSRKIVARISGYYGGVPFFEKDRMYLTGDCSEVVCARLPF